MSSNAWTYQRSEHVRDMGEAKAPWYVGWYEPDGRRKAKSFGPGVRGKDKADRFRRKVEAEMMCGVYEAHARKPWADFRKEYSSRVLEGLAVHTRLQAETSLDHFERIVKPLRVFALSTQHIDDFTAARRQERGRRQGDVISPFSVNKDLRHVKAALAVAAEWGYLPKMPKFRMEKTPGKLPRYVKLPDALQALMRHKSYTTTQVYINMARQMDAAVAGLHVPDVLRQKDRQA
jgi:hypothetical protein